MGAGILPVAIINGKIYFLFSREQNSENNDYNQWSDFGGRKEKNETYKETAIREGWEESDGFLGGIFGGLEGIMTTVILIAVLLIGGYVFLVVGVPYLKARQKKKEMEGMRESRRK